ncbi:MAG: hypothetical protein SD837_19255 [Candidatus Electrothrix scaldis]|nr:MAG: hypothetical protein SD837_19255 [Candidatus Electrothrix sp. GW3-3]
MDTEFKLIFTDQEVAEKGFKQDLTQFKNSLPSTFSIIERDNEYYISIKTSRAEDDSAQYLIDRELEKYFFLTRIDIKAEMVRNRIESFFNAPLLCYGYLDKNMLPQDWNSKLPLQLRLWKLAEGSKNNRLKMLYYFHIIELSYPNTNNNEQYPLYTDSAIPPHPRTECKFLRNLIAHAGEVSANQLKTYCDYLEIPNLMFDEIESKYQEIMIRKVNLLREQAMIVIEEKLTSKNSRNRRGWIQDFVMSMSGCQKN